MVERAAADHAVEEIEMIRNGVIVVATVAACAGLAPVAHAAPVLPGETVLLNGTEVSESPWLTGFGDKANFSPFEVRDGSGRVIASGVLRSEHIRSNIFGTQILQYRIESIQNFDGAVVRVANITFPGYDGLTTNADWRTGAGRPAEAPTSVARDLDSTGDQVRFAFTSAQPRPGFDSPSFYILSNAAHFREDGVAVTRMNTGQDVVVTGLYAPFVAEPASCAGDTVGDGVINFADLNAVLSNFGQSCD